MNGCGAALMLLLGCRPDAPDQVDGAAPATPTDPPEGSDAPIVEPAAPPVTVEVVEGQEGEPDDLFFNDHAIHTIELTLAPGSRDALAAAPYEVVRADAVIDGITLADVGVRLRGKIGSFRTLDAKAKLRIDFNAFVPGRRYAGLEGLWLNNEVADCSFLREVTSYRIFRQAGVPTSRTSWSNVTIDGSEYGLYAVVEVQDDRFLERSWALPEGNLYDGKYAWYGGWDYTLLDFIPEVQHLFTLEEGVDVGIADIQGVTAAIAASWLRPGWPALTGQVVDWPQVHRLLAVEELVGQNDGYALNQNNYRLYFDPEDGKVEIVPCDLDYSWLYDWEWGMDWQSPRGVLAAGCWADATCRAEHVQVVRQIVSGLDMVDLLAWYDEMDALTWDAAAADPRKECSATDVRWGRDDLRARIVARPDLVRASWTVSP